MLIFCLVSYFDNKTKTLAHHCDNTFSNEALTLSFLFNESSFQTKKRDKLVFSSEKSLFRRKELFFSDEKSVTSGIKALEEVVRLVVSKGMRQIWRWLETRNINGAVSTPGCLLTLLRKLSRFLQALTEANAGTKKQNEYESCTRLKRIVRK